ncbi:MAG: ribonuclease HI [Lachnospiraceae bacterium]|jgi:ribonuclease HI|nr:ribonuclease HI [Lachnospiraceae bacterium]MBQ6319866.1 ribonuclease HI [Lachnospiraceae bacterium]MBQ8007831.1 ribonuclease HI [Lachnospiraceae bacterium]
MKVTIYTDGSARGNPDGPGGYGVILHYTDPKGNLHESTRSAGYKKTTNNRMELMGVIAGLESLNRPCDVEIVSDSKYVTDAFNQDWIGSWIKNGWKKSDKKPVLNTDLWKRLLEAKAPHNVTFTWVKGHNDHPENERCDKMAVEAALSSELLDDVAE